MLLFSLADCNHFLLFICFCVCILSYYFSFHVSNAGSDGCIIQSYFQGDPSSFCALCMLIQVCRFDSGTFSVTLRTWFLLTNVSNGIATEVYSRTSKGL